ncbi:hypothetical protein LguiA_018013 [Lonicera macranthoides]
MDNKNISHHQNRDGLLLRSSTTHHHQSEIKLPATTSTDFVLQWGNRKRLRCMKVQVKDNGTGNESAGNTPLHRTTVRIDRRVVRSDHNHHIKDTSTSAKPVTAAVASTVNNGNGYLNLRQRSASPAHRILRNSEGSIGMKGQSNGVSRRVCSPDRVGAQDKRGAHNSNTHHNNTAATTPNCINNNNNGGGGGGSGSSETAHDSRKGGSSSGSEAIPVVWPPKFVIGLTNKEKEEDFMAIKGSKLPQRPKKRAKFIQRTLNLVSPGAWLCDLTLERYEVREKKISKKRPRGLKAMGNMMESDSE